MKVNPKTIQALTLFVLTLFVPRKDIREYLRNINFELQLDKTILTATNGQVLLTVCVDAPNEKADTFRIPPGFFLKSEIDYEVSRAEDGKVYITNGFTKTEVPQTEGVYPDSRRVIPTNPAKELEHKCYDPEHLMLFKRASKLLGGAEYPIIYPNGVVDIGLWNAVGVVARLNLANLRDKGYQVVDTSPSWLYT